MFIAKNNNLIVLACDKREDLDNSLKFIVYDKIEETDKSYALYEGEYLTPEEIEARKTEKFQKEFFDTSLGYIRRKVNMKNGETKDFLTDIVPRLKEGVRIITYNADGTQNIGVEVTEQFINECDNQLLQDFYGTLAH